MQMLLLQCGSPEVAALGSRRVSDFGPRCAPLRTSAVHLAMIASIYYLPSRPCLLVEFLPAPPVGFWAVLWFESTGALGGLASPIVELIAYICWFVALR
jgi:hypothetical protein